MAKNIKIGEDGVVSRHGHRVGIITSDGLRLDDSSGPYMDPEMAVLSLEDLQAVVEWIQKHPFLNSAG